MLIRLIKRLLNLEFELAAFSSRLPHDKMTFEEVNLFRDIIEDDIGSCTTKSQIENYKTFIFIRNKIVSSLN